MIKTASTTRLSPQQVFPMFLSRIGAAQRSPEICTEDREDRKDWREEKMCRRRAFSAEPRTPNVKRVPHFPLRPSRAILVSQKLSKARTLERADSSKRVGYAG